MNRFTFTLMNYGADLVLDSLLKSGLESGIKNIYTNDAFFITVEFNNGLTMRAWNVNKYYAWLHEGIFTFPDGKCYRWQDGRPKRKTMARLYKSLRNFF